MTLRPAVMGITITQASRRKKPESVKYAAVFAMTYDNHLCRHVRPDVHGRQNSGYESRRHHQAYHDHHKRLHFAYDGARA